MGFDPNLLGPWPNYFIKRDKLEDLIKSFASSHAHSILVLSSEAFYISNNIYLFKELAINIGLEVEFVIFVRDPFEFYRSWYQEAVQSTAITSNFGQFFINYKKDFNREFQKISEVAPLHVKPMFSIDESGKKFNVISSFLEIIGAPSLTSELHATHQNPSISGNLFLLKRMLNLFICEDECEQLAFEFAKISAIDPDFQGKIKIDLFEFGEFGNFYKDDLNYFEELTGVRIEEKNTILKERSYEIGLLRRHSDLKKIYNFCREEKLLTAKVMERAGII